MRTCRKCKVTKVIESRKYCDNCKIKLQVCECGTTFKSKHHKYCKICRASKGNTGVCFVCEKTRHIYFNTQMCTTCHRTTLKYNLTKEELKQLRQIKNCQLCGIEFDKVGCIDHCHTTGRVRGVLCNKCNVIEGMFRNQEHLDKFYESYRKYTKSVS